MNRFFVMFKLEPLVKLDELWRISYRNGYEKPRLIHRIGMYEMLWLVFFAVFTFRTIHQKIAFFGLIMLVAWMAWIYFGPFVSILDTDSGRIRRLTRKDFIKYKKQMKNKNLWPTPVDVGIGLNEKIPNVKR